MKLHHVLRGEQFSDLNLQKEIFTLANELEQQDKNQNLPEPLANKIVATLFYEPSTRSRLSFESAIYKLGGNNISTENASRALSSVKGESLEDTIQILNSYSNAIVLRHPSIGSAEAAAKVSNVPIINAGDGAGEHPTQALYDVYTLQKEFGIIDKLKIAMVGDLLFGRTIHSLLHILSVYKNLTVYLVSPESLKLPEKYKQFLLNKGIKFTETAELTNVLEEVNVIYMTRIQKERFASENDYQKVKGVYVINNQTLRKMGEKTIIMHPLPRVGEINPEIDNDPRAAYFRQAKNGLYIRMALLHKILCE